MSDRAVVEVKNGRSGTEAVEQSKNAAVRTATIMKTISIDQMFTEHLHCVNHYGCIILF